MKLITVAAVLGLATPAFLHNISINVSGRGRDSYPLVYDEMYDQPQLPLGSVICSNGPYGLITTRGFNTLSQIPTYPAVGGIPMIDSWESSNCGTCWQLTYTDVNGNAFSILFTAVNVGQQNPDAFTISKESLEFLTNSNADTVDGGTIHVAQMLGSACQLP